MTRIRGRVARVAAGAALAMLGAAGMAARDAVLTHDLTPYAEMCDASAAISVGPDTFIVANDEDNVLRAYKVGAAAPVARVPLSFLKARKEADIEGAARLGDVVYWIASHGRNKDGEPRPDRLTFFGTRIRTEDGRIAVTPEGKPYRKLLDTFIQPLLARHELPDAATRAPESEDALNIEGLAASGASLLIGFRNPLPKGKALVAELTNPAALLADPSSTAHLGKVFELDLGGHGIRSIEWISPEQGFLIIAGPAGGSGEFAVYRWRDTTQAPTRVSGATFSDFGAEALFAGPPSSLYVLSDDGDRPIAGGPCKEAPVKERRFRLARLTLD